MALIPCRDCGRPISDQAVRCPHCGARPIKPFWRRPAVWIVGGLLGFGLLASLGSHNRPAVRDAPPTSAGPGIVVRGDLAPYSVDEVARAILLLRDACRPLGGAMWGELAGVEVSIERDNSYLAEAYGWRTAIEVRLVVPQSPKLIPATSAGIGVIAGQTLSYRLGAGARTGLVISKRAAKYLCGLPATNGDDVFIDLPELRFLAR